MSVLTDRWAVFNANAITSGFISENFYLGGPVSCCGCRLRLTMPSPFNVFMQSTVDALVRVTSGGRYAEVEFGLHLCPECLSSGHTYNNGGEILLHNFISSVVTLRGHLTVQLKVELQARVTRMQNVGYLDRDLQQWVTTPTGRLPAQPQAPVAIPTDEPSPSEIEQDIEDDYYEADNFTDELINGVHSINLSGGLLEYDYKVDCVGLKLPKDRTDLFLGVELEMINEGRHETYSDTIKKLSSLMADFAVLKSDGSLDSGGIELVSRPATLEFHLAKGSKWHEFFRRRTEEYLRSLRSYSYECCGMHVHVSRNALTLAQIGKISAFLNDYNNEDFVSAVAQREINSEHEYAATRSCVSAVVALGDTAIKRSSDNRVYSWRKWGKHELAEAFTNKYSVLNLRNDETIEFRLFKGTLNQNSFFKNLEFCHALAGFCGEASLADLSWKTFVTWAQRKAYLYPYLSWWLQRKNYVSAIKVKAFLQEPSKDPLEV